MPPESANFAFFKDLHGRLVDRPLAPGDPYYVPLHEGPDREDPVDRMATYIGFSDEESIQLFSGFRGSGKTTELFRLRQRLEQDGYVVVYADALTFLNPAEPVDIAELLIVVAAAFGEAISLIPGAAIPVASFWDRLTNFLTNTEVRVSQAGITAGAETPLGAVLGKLKTGVDLKLELKTASSFRQNLQRVLNNQLNELQQQVADHFADMIKRIRLERGKDTRVVFLFDQLEQMRGGLSTEQDVIRSVERIFTLHLDRLRLPYMHVVYTVPPWLKFVGTGTVEMALLPTCHLWDNKPDRPDTPAALDAFRDVVRKRLTDDGLRRILGEDAARRDRHIDTLIRMSGGHLRDLLRLLREVIMRATTLRSLPVPDSVINSAIAAVRRDFLPIAQSDAVWLAEIAAVRATALPNIEAQAVNRLSRFLDNHYVLYFVNDDEWFDIHPLIREEVAKVVAAGSDHPGASDGGAGSGQDRAAAASRRTGAVPGRTSAG